MRKFWEHLDNTGGHFKSYKTGTHRSCLPEETLGKVLKFMPVFGITRIANITGLDVIGIPVIAVVRPNSRSLSVSQGKGLSLAAAKISGIMESIEAYHAETLDIPTRLLSHDDLTIRHQSADMAKLSRSCERTFCSDSKIPWVVGHDLMNHCETWVPYEIVHSDYTHPLPFDSGYFIADSNGLASGNCIVEAINHGICEVIERDALTLWSLQSTEERNACRVDLQSIDDPECARLIETYERRGINVAVWDITTDVDVPVYVCKIMQAADSDISGIRPAMGAGCHSCKAIALSRALTEAAQSRLTFISGARDDQFRKTYQRYQMDDIHQSWKNEMRKTGNAINFSVRPDFTGSMLEDDMEWLLGKLKATGLTQTIFVNLTKEEFGISVVKVIIPGLECHTAPEKRILGARGMARISGRNEEGESHE